MRLTCGSSPVSVLSWDGLKLVWTKARVKGETECLSYFHGALGCSNECSEVDVMIADEKRAVTSTAELTAALFGRLQLGHECYRKYMWKICIASNIHSFKSHSCIEFKYLGFKYLVSHACFFYSP